MQNTNPPKNAVIYCRVSTKEQVEEGNSLVTQEKNCREYAIKNDFSVARIFIEQGESAKTADRTELRKLLAYCGVKKNNITALIIYKIDRLSRNIDDYSEIRTILKRCGVEIRSTSEFFENTPAGKFMENILANVAQFDNDVRTERSVGGMKQAVLEGRYIWPAPFGYSNVRQGGKANIAINEKSRLVKLAFIRATNINTPIEDIRRFLADLGLNQGNGKPIAKSALYRLLKHPVYAGYIVKFGMKVKGSFEPIVSEELFDAVQRRFQKRSKERQYRVENSDFPLRRIIISTEGEKLTGSWSQGRRKKYPYYRFIKGGKMFPKEQLEKKFLLFLDSYALNPHLFDVFKTRVINVLKHKTIDNLQIVNNSKVKLEQLYKRRQIILDKGFSGVINDDTLKEQLGIVDDEICSVQLEVESMLLNPYSSADLLADFQQFFVFPGAFWAKQPFSLKKKLLWFEFPNSIVFDGEEFRTQEICSLFKVNRIFSNKKYQVVGSKGLSYRHPKEQNLHGLSDEAFLAELSKLDKSLLELDTIMKSIEEEDVKKD